MLFLFDFCVLSSAKIPFPLTQRFRSMLQNGIDLSTVDVSYVSSRSWYITMFLIHHIYLNCPSWKFNFYLLSYFLADSPYLFTTISFRYFLNLFGLRGLFSLILGEENGSYWPTNLFFVIVNLTWIGMLSIFPPILLNN